MSDFQPYLAEPSVAAAEFQEAPHLRQRKQPVHPASHQLDAFEPEVVEPISALPSEADPVVERYRRRHIRWLAPYANTIRYLYESTTLQQPYYHYAGLWALYFGVLYLIAGRGYGVRWTLLSWASWLTFSFFAGHWLLSTLGAYLPQASRFHRQQYVDVRAELRAGRQLPSTDPFYKSADLLARAQRELTVGYRRYDAMRREHPGAFALRACIVALALWFIGSWFSGITLFMLAFAGALAAPALLRSDLPRRALDASKPYMTRADAMMEDVVERTSHVAHAAGEVASEVAHSAADAALVAQEKLSGAAHVAGEAAHRAQETLSEAAHVASDTASQVAQRARGAIEVTKEQARAAGTVAADVAQRAKQQASDVAARVTHRTSEVAQATAEQASSTAQAAAEKSAELAHAATEKTAELAHAATEKTTELAHAATEKSAELAHAATKKASETAQRAGEKASETAQRAGEAVSETAQQAADISSAAANKASAKAAEASQAAREEPEMAREAAERPARTIVTERTVEQRREIAPEPSSEEAAASVEPSAGSHRHRIEVKKVHPHTHRPKGVYLSEEAHRAADKKAA